jgi:D-alanine-D-alanine ligase
MDKIVAKELFGVHGVPTPAGGIAATVAEAAAIGTPCVIKPAAEGSSVGVTIVTDAAGLEEAFERAAACHGPVMVEPYIAGYEIQTGILGSEVLGSVEVRPAVEFYDYQAKYKRDDTQYLVPPEIDPAWTARAEEAALAAFRALRCRAYGRVDLRISEAGEPFVLEVNTLPGMTSHSLLPKIAARAGLDYATLCERILELAL